MNKTLSILIALGCGIVLGFMAASIIPRGAPKSDCVYIKDFLVRDADTAEQLNATVGTTRDLAGDLPQFLLEMPHGGPYRVTTTDRRMTNIAIKAEGYSPVMVPLECFTHYLTMAGRIGTEVILLKKVPNKTLDDTSQ